MKANGRIQKLKLLRRGSAMSGAPTCRGICQLARPVHAGMTAPKIISSAFTMMIATATSSMNCECSGRVMKGLISAACSA